MSGDQQSYPLPQVFLVDAGGPQHPDQQPSLVPCWSFPPAREPARARGRSRGCMGVGAGPALVALMLFLLVFACLGLGAYQIHNMQAELRETREMRKVVSTPDDESRAPQRQIAHQLEMNEGDEEERPAAHVIGRIETDNVPRTLRWDPRSGRAFESGAVSYRAEDGGLQPNRSGLYHVYSRVELIFNDCSPASSFVHSVFVRRAAAGGGRPPSPLTLMEAHRAGFCSAQRGHVWTADSYLAGAVRLQRNDRVFVNVSQPSFLSHSHYANFFGLYKI
ncbi:tumor necrosis factor ligand superfamily member 6 [Pseudoliparis swirei]|uniref:tumor necrosis factor ligand superfamily member 6 n=1 Tax=Pseudoliparis swirei TaxID=2059687 RepID=UPI0024BDDF5B|nr:tumor necrosis factor ligand superfamily member 6 [Pseudoliparis swirei]